MGNFLTKDDVVMFFESLPCLGYGVSAVHGILGDRDRAIRAAARCTNSSVRVLCEILGSLLAMPGGALLGAAAGAAVGWVLELSLIHI